MATKYTYSISEDFPNGKVEPGKLVLEIRESAITIAADYVNANGDDCDIWFKAELPSGDQTVLDAVVAAHDGEPLPDAEDPKTDLGVPIFQYQLPEGRRCDHYTPNFCDKTTWYHDSERHTDEALVDSGDHTTYNLSTPCVVVDLKHGKVFGEDNLVGDYGTVVKVDDVEKTENSPGTTDGDYWVNYATGAVTFNTALAGTEAVTMTYSKVQSSLCKVMPPTGKKLRVGYVEVQFSKDIGTKDTLIFQMWGLSDVFAPGQFPPGTMIPISGAEKYKTLNDFIADAEKAYPVIPVMTGAGDSWRMYQQERIIYRFDYTSRAATDMLSSYGMEIRVWLENDVPYEGEYAVGTFYGVKVDE
jgi:hypothetical protein